MKELKRVDCCQKAVISWKGFSLDATDLKRQDGRVPLNYSAGLEVH